jgi:endonuclease/exonuclease/phosphatase family metal-dependent hydrolase
MHKLVAIGLVLLIACGGDDDAGDDDDVVDVDAAANIDATPAVDATPPDATTPNLPETLPDPLPAGDPAVKLVTYNTAMLQTIKYVPQRLPLVTEALKVVDADVLCLQELWDEFTSPADMATRLSAEFPYAWWTWEGTATFGNGVLIVSKHPLYRGRVLTYSMNEDEGNLDRMAIAADVVTADSYFHVICGHTQAGSSTLQTTMRQSNITEMDQLVASEGWTGEPVFLLGDMNCGPQTGPCVKEPCEPADTESYDLLLTTWTDPNQGSSDCTYCQEFARPLQLIGGIDDDPDVRIDFCLYRDLGTSALQASSILFDDEVTYDIGGGTNVTTTRSDHLGVYCEFAPE